MKFFGNRMALGFVAAFALASGAGAATSKSAAGPRKGPNVSGRTGLIFTDTAQTVGAGRGQASAHVLLATDDDFDKFSLPVGFSFGPADDIELGANLDFVSLDPDRGDNESGLGTFTGSGRWKLPVQGADVP